ncbi:MAG: hypothetical protein JSS95_14220 [Acidobacteria bacterium]|nr:hypothetical protein [Acidobacteriota bacterium]
MDRGLLLKLIWKDNDMVEARLSSWNGEFGGTADIYLSYGVLPEMAHVFDGFPQRPSDVREFILGDLDGAGCGGASVRLHKIDLAGHMAVTLTVLTGTRNGANQTVTLHAPIEAAAVDNFVAELKKIDDEVGPTAFLRFNT